MFLIDHLRNNPSAVLTESDCPDYSRKHVVDSIRSAVHIDVQNVYEYMQSKEKWGYSAIPYAIPPFPCLFLEFQVDQEKTALMHEKYPHMDKMDFRLAVKQGILILSGNGKQKVNCLYVHMFRSIYQTDIKEFIQVQHEAVVILKADKNGSILKEYSDNSLFGKTKRLLGRKDEDFSYSIKFYDTERFESKLNQEQQKTWANENTGFRRAQDSTWHLTLMASLLSFSFMNCKNVELATKREAGPMFSWKKNKLPNVKTYTLTINPIKKIIAGSNSGNSDLTPKALHICRGHFKDFSHGRGLFGKYKGSYWWPMTTRGTKAAGEIIKDYKIGVVVPQIIKDQANP